MKKGKRRSIRLPEYDYSSRRAYFVTICVQSRVSLFGQVVGDEMELSPAGMMVRRIWAELPSSYPGVEVDAFVVMPNHVHGIVLLTGGASTDRRTMLESGQARGPAPTAFLSLPDVIQRFKSLTTREYIDGVRTCDWEPFSGRLWQRNYYERIIRFDGSLERVRHYINTNPQRWKTDPENPSIERDTITD